MTTLPVREIVLYKHGVGFFIRAGAVTGEEITLTFRQDEINDVLKSLTVFDRAGGQVLGIHYQTPMDKAARLANSSIHLDDKTSLRDLLRDLRGRKVTFMVEDEVIQGRVIGLDEASQEEQPAQVAVLVDEKRVRVFPLPALHDLAIEDDLSGHDLRYFLDTTVGEDTRRLVTIQLSPGDHDLLMNYVMPSPIWRVSYRLVAETLEQGGRAILQGWGLFDNRLDEDLEKVQVTLVAGQPISFIYDLYSSEIPRRPKVKDEARLVSGPIEYETEILDDQAVTGSAAYSPAYPMPAAAPQAKARGGVSFGNLFGAGQPITRDERESIDLHRARLQSITAHKLPIQTKDTGEFFQYVITTPVSVKRGDSALVPIISQEVRYQRELLYNGSKLPNHPVSALRFNNSTGLILERGPVTLVEDGDYRGEAVIPFTREGNDIYLPYAVELGVRVSESTSHRYEDESTHLEGDYFVYRSYQIEETHYTLHNATQREVTVIIEAPLRHGWELLEPPAPDATTLTDRHWRVAVPPRRKAEFTRQERFLRERREMIKVYKGLRKFLHNLWQKLTGKR